MTNLKNNIAIITGGTQGLGKAVAREFASNGAAGLIICGRSAVKGRDVAKSITSCPVEFVQADLGSVQDCVRVVEAAKAHFGRVDCLVNAGATTARGGMLDTSPELFDEIMAVNIRGPFFLMQAAIRLMLETKTEGAIVNIGSMSGHVGQSFLTPYAISKGALATLTRNAANSLMRHRIRVNGLNIGWMESDQEKALHAAQGHGDDWFAERATELPFGRLIQPTEIARAVSFLCSDESGLMTGEMINFDQTIWGANEDPPAMQDTTE